MLCLKIDVASLAIPLPSSDLQGEGGDKAFLLEFMPPTRGDSIAPQCGRSDLLHLRTAVRPRYVERRPYRRFGYWLANIIFDVSGAPAFRMATKSLSN